MQKLNVAIIGQGRSGRDIHGAYFLSERNKYYNVKYVVELDKERRNNSLDRYKGCEVLENYQDLFSKPDVDLVVNSTFSYMHYEITKDLLLHGKNVLVEKPFAKTKAQCDELIEIAKDKGVVLAVFQNTSKSPYYEHVLDICHSDKIGDIVQVTLRFTNLSRRWDWQTSIEKLGGIVYNMGPHIIGIAMGIYDFDDNTKVTYSKTLNSHASGDAEDFAKVLLTAPNKPDIDIEFSSSDGFPDNFVKIQGTRGTYAGGPEKYELVYFTLDENPPKPYDGKTLKIENALPTACIENLILHREKGDYPGTAFDIGTAGIYEDVYFAITEHRPLKVRNEDVAKIIEVMETIHKQNPREITLKQ